MRERASSLVCDVDIGSQIELTVSVKTGSIVCSMRGERMSLSELEMGHREVYHL